MNATKSVTRSVTSLDAEIEAAFGRSVTALHEDGEHMPPVLRVLELRAGLAVVEHHLDRIRDRLHTATLPGRSVADLAADDLTTDVEWLAAASRARTQHTQAITRLLRVMPPPAAPRGPARGAQTAAFRTEPPQPAAATTLSARLL